MEIDKNNFQEKYEEIMQLIDGCDFITIDTELTGLYTEKTNYYDTPELRYKQSRNFAMQYAVTQFGICTFKYHSESKCISYAPVNFHLLSKSKSEKDNFSISIDTVHFLNEHNFDFNKTFIDGLSFIRLSEYEQRKSLLALKRNHELITRDSNNVEALDFSSINQIITECTAFLEKNIDEIIIPDNSNPYEKYLIDEHLANKVGCINDMWIFPTFFYDKEAKKKSIRITKCASYKESKEKQFNEKYKNLENSLKKHAQFSELIKYIGQSKKFVIGHNCLLDGLHMYDKFIGPLPQEYKVFKKSFNELFPNFIDTKHLVIESKHPLFQSMYPSDLKACYEATKAMSNNPEYKPHNEHYAFADGVKYHTAHYDAFITGQLFLNLANELAPMASDFYKNFSTEAANVLKKYTNRFNLVNAEQNFLDLNPEFVDANNLHKHVFHITIPNVWQRIDVLSFLATLLSKDLKNIMNTVKLEWIDDKSLMVKLPDTVHPRDVRIGSHGDVTIKTYSQHFNLENNSAMEADGFTMAKTSKRRKLMNTE